MSHEITVSRKEFEALKNENKMLARDSAVLRTGITLGEAGIAALGFYAAATGNMGPVQTDDSLARLAAFAGASAVTVDVVRGGRSIANLIDKATS
jgi:hypothetical protein